MIGRINVHLDREKAMIKVDKEIKDFEGHPYIPIILGELNLFTNKEQAEILFNQLDAVLHENTYTELEDRCLNLESDLVVANEIIEELEDKVQENFK